MHVGRWATFPELVKVNIKANKQIINSIPALRIPSIFLKREGSTDAQHVELPYSMFTFKNKHSASYKITVSVNDTPVEMEIDTGAAFSVTSEDTYEIKIPEWYFKHTPPPP